MLSSVGTLKSHRSPQVWAGVCILALWFGGIKVEAQGMLQTAYSACS
jgi:hypothetical protein